MATLFVLNHLKAFYCPVSPAGLRVLVKGKLGVGFVLSIVTQADLWLKFNIK